MFIYLFAAVIIINCAYYLLFFTLSFSKRETTPLEEVNLPISVLVYVKNNASQILENLEAILQQDYPNFEMVLINDDSSDNSLELLEEFQNKHDNFPIHISNVKGNETFWGSKKYALTLGIKRANYPNMLFTDGNCKPMSQNWIRHMASGFSSSNKIVLGYSNYKQEKGFLNLILRFDTMLNAIHYLSFAKAKMTYMGVGKNLAYTSDVYYDNRGFISHVKLPVGDDDLFVNEVANKYNTATIYHPDSFIEAEAISEWADWFNIKKNRAWSFRHYKLKHKVLLLTYFFSSSLFWVLTAASFFFLPLETCLILIGIRVLLQYLSIGINAYKLGGKRMIFFIPFLELILILLQIRKIQYYLIEPKLKW